MTMIQCPTCGKMISANASACPSCGEPMVQELSGTETFSAQGGNRLELSARTQATINANTTRLANEGKTVVSVDSSIPQAFTLGFTVWRQDITIVWKATQASVYQKAKTFYDSGSYEEAKKLFNELPGYLDSQALAGTCQAKIEEKRKMKEIAASAAAQAKAWRKANGIKEEPSVAWPIWGMIIAFIGTPVLIGGLFSYDGPFNSLTGWGGGLVALGGIFFAIFAIKGSAYDKQRKDIFSKK